MKKILYITTVNSTINAFLIPHIKMLIKNGYRVDCASSINQDISNELIKIGVGMYKISFSRNPLNFRNIKAFKELIEIQKENNYDIIHVHTPVASIYGRLVKIRFSKLKTIYTAHGYHFFKGASKAAWLIYYPIEKIMANLTDVTININSEDYEFTKDKLKPKKCYFINGVGIDLNQYKILDEKERIVKRKEFGLSKEDFVVIMIAELNENKNQIQLIKALEVLKDKYSNIKALIVGEGDKLKKLKEEAKNRGIANNINFLGFRTDVNEIINISDIGILLSYREGLPRNIMELMANGKKVIATNIRGCRDLICNDNVGTLVQVGDFGGTSIAIEKYYLERESREEIDTFCKNNNEKYVIREIEIYDVNNVIRKLKNIYKELS